jgi:hypothetical protein
MLTSGLERMEDFAHGLVEETQVENESVSVDWKGKNWVAE